MPSDGPATTDLKDAIVIHTSDFKELMAPFSPAVSSLSPAMVGDAKLVDDRASAMKELTSHLLPESIPLFLILLHRLVKTYTSRWTRVGLISLAVATYISRKLKGDLLGKLLKKHFMCTAELSEEDETFDMLLDFISHQKFAQNSRTFLPKNPHQKKGMPEPETLEFVLAPGTYYFWHKSNFYIFVRGLISIKSPEMISISSLGRNPANLKKFLNECRTEFIQKSKGKTSISIVSDDRWVRAMKRPYRLMSSVVLDPEQKSSLLKDIESYLSLKQQKWYTDRGIPYRRGYLLHGPPGTGKSSLSFAIAGHFDLPIYMVSLNSPTITEDVLSCLFRRLPARCVILMEDIDAAGMAQSRKTKSTGSTERISLSSVLNVIDGVASQEGRILIMTTNHIENLDDALIRPGRVDMVVPFSNATKSDLMQIFNTIYLGPQDESDQNDTGATDSPETIVALSDEASQWKKLVLNAAERFSNAMPADKFSPAEIQGYLIGNKDDPDAAAEKAAEWATATLASKAEEKEVEETEDEDEDEESASESESPPQAKAKTKAAQNKEKLIRQFEAFIKGSSAMPGVWKE